jgi:4-hydroxybenzoate polyprenyltransferase
MIAVAFWLAGVGLVGWLGLAVVALLLARQIGSLEIDDPEQCLALFKFNGVVGLILFVGLIAALPFA